MASINFLIFGDIAGKPGRHAIKAKLDKLKKKYQPDFILANAENLAHGYGVTEKTLKEMSDAGIDFFTSGNHVFTSPKDLDKIFKQYPLIRPVNYPEGTPGQGYKIIEIGITKVLIINLQGRVFFPQEDLNDPFKALDNVLAETKNEKIKIILVDLHAEATSEKKSLGAYADGRVSLLYGTHTHIPTADEQLLPKGTGYITDVGMAGIKHSSLGMDFENIINNFLEYPRQPKLIPDHGICIINGIFAKIDIETGKAISIERIVDEVEV